jgi:prepilin-type N-terminal cleavage/methylation domain-containing protein
MPQRHPLDTPKEGFTLVEMSIVLVVIGLLVGVILVGMDLINAAALRGTVSQVGRFDAAVHTFKLKYNALPGDIIPSEAGAYGLFQLSNVTGGRGDGDGNSLIEDGGCVFPFNCNGGSNGNQFCGEIATFWRHLSDAKLIDGQFGTTGNSAINALTCTPTGDVTTVSQSMPAAKLGHGVSITVISGDGANYYALLPVIAVVNLASYTVGNTGMSPIEASSIDEKIDDGQPETGIVVAIALKAPGVDGNSGTITEAGRIGAGLPTAAATSTSNKCVIGTGWSATDTYNRVLGTGGSDLPCGLAIRFQ